MNKPLHKNRKKRNFALVTLIFVILTFSLEGLMAFYWYSVMKPRLRHGAHEQAKFLAQSQSGILADALSSSNRINPGNVIDAMDHILLFSDPVSNSPFFLNITLTVDYDTVPADKGTLEIELGASECDECFLVEVPIYSKTTDELLGVAFFQVSGKFFQLLSNDIRNKILVGAGVSFCILVIVWLSVIYLTKKLQMQIDERGRAEVALSGALREQEAIMAAMPDIFYMFDLNGCLIKWNKKMEDLTGLSSKKLKGKHILSFVPEDEGKEIGEAFKEVFIRGIHWINGHMIDRNGDHVPYHFSGVVIKNMSGEHIGLAGIGRDITESKRTELEIRQYAEKLKHSNKELHDFAYTASHDLQEPLRKVQWFSNLLGEKYGHAVKGEGGKYLDSIQKAVYRMQKLINDLLSYSQVTTMAKPFITTELTAVANEAVEDLQVLIAETKGSVEIGKMPAIDADPAQMRRLFQNLIGNSLKYRKKEEPPVIKVSTDIKESKQPGQEGNRCFILVKDNGIGFDEKYNDKIFKIFQRLHGMNEYRGTGIGLALCRKIVKRHGGMITAKSKPEQGAEFTITLPVKQTTTGET